MSEPKAKSYSRSTQNPEAGLTEAEKKVRRELLASERPVTAAAIEIARLRDGLENISCNALTIEDAVRMSDAALVARENDAVKFRQSGDISMAHQPTINADGVACCSGPGEP